MIRTKYELLMQRFRAMMTESGACSKTVTNAELLEKVKGETHEEKMRNVEAVLSLTSERYWHMRGL
jgi:hypothetical protein